MRELLVRHIPGFLKPPMKRMLYFLVDSIDTLNGRDSMVPPRSLIFIGQGDFEKIGQEFKNYFIELADLKPNERVLDAGCGIGRMAIPLTDYLAEEGEYWGFDIVREGIKWCESRVSSKFSNFHFQHVDVFNKHYNAGGTIRARDFVFPFDDGFFDFVFLTSVFTHMLPADQENYLREIARVLKSGGRCLISFFLLNRESKELIHEGRSSQDFRYAIENSLTINPDDPEAAIAYEEEQVNELFGRVGLTINPPIHYGSWCKRERHLAYQDLIIARKIA